MEGSSAGEWWLYQVMGLQRGMDPPVDERLNTLLQPYQVCRLECSGGGSVCLEQVEDRVEQLEVAMMREQLNQRISSETQSCIKGEFPSCFSRDCFGFVWVSGCVFSSV